MARILITGGTGVLGRQLTPRLSAQGHTVRILSRAPRRSGFAPKIEWAQAKLEPGHELAAALALLQKPGDRGKLNGYPAQTHLDPGGNP